MEQVAFPEENTRAGRGWRRQEPPAPEPRLLLEGPGDVSAEPTDVCGHLWDGTSRRPRCGERDVR